MIKQTSINARNFGISLVLGGIIWSFNTSITKAVQLADGTVAFAHPPRLLNAITTFRSVRARAAKYYFTISLPANSDEPLQKVVINLRRGADQINYYLEKTIATSETASKTKQNIALKDVKFNDETQTITIDFAQPIVAGTTFTIGLKPKRNPDWGGTYLFGVTAFPAGEKSQGIYLGAGRLQFDEPNDINFDL